MAFGRGDFFLRLCDEKTPKPTTDLGVFDQRDSR